MSLGGDVPMMARQVLAPPAGGASGASGAVSGIMAANPYVAAAGAAADVAKAALSDGTTAQTATNTTTTHTGDDNRGGFTGRVFSSDNRKVFGSGARTDGGQSASASMATGGSSMLIWIFGGIAAVVVALGIFLLSRRG